MTTRPARQALLLSWLLLLGGCAGFPLPGPLGREAPGEPGGMAPGAQEEAELNGSQAAPGGPQQAPSPEPAEPDWNLATTDGDYREGIFEILVPPGESREYGIDLREGDAIVFFWSSISEEPALTLRSRFRVWPATQAGEPGGPLVLDEHQQAQGQGFLKAPRAGRLWWQFENGGTEELRILLRVAGFYHKLPETHQARGVTGS